MPGPAKKPTALKLIQGTANRNKNRQPKNEAKPTKPARVPSPPSYLGKMAKAEWRRLSKELFALGLLTTVDVKILAAYCQAYEEMLTAQGLMAAWNLQNPKSQNVQKTGAGGFKTHPYVLQARDARRDMLRLAQEFGLTPASRGRISLPDAGKADNPFDQFK